MSVSVIIPTLLSSSSVEQPLESVVRSVHTIDGAEILVIANGPQPRWHGAVLEARNVRILQCADLGPAAARNMGMAHARHRIVLFTDDDCIVPPTWCQDLTSGLASPGTAAVAAPVGIIPVGPVTAFLNYQRIFDAPPLDASTVRYLITANCAVDRARTTATFESELFRFVGGEDAEFGYQIRDGGGTITWLDGAPPVTQCLAEDITQITERFHRYGRGSALLYQHQGRNGESVPGAIEWFADLAAGQADDRRRFREFRDPPIRTAFTSIELITTASWLLGYLREMGSLLQHEIVEVDWSGLSAGWREVGEWISDVSAGIDWAALDPDPGLMLATVPAAADLRGAIGDVLARHTRIASHLPEHVIGALDRHTQGFRADLASASDKAADLAGPAASSSLKINDLRHELRAAGLPFRDGMHDLEQAVARRIGL